MILVVTAIKRDANSKQVKCRFEISARNVDRWGNEILQKALADIVLGKEPTLFSDESKEDETE